MRRERERGREGERERGREGERERGREGEREAQASGAEENSASNGRSRVAPGLELTSEVGAGRGGEEHRQCTLRTPALLPGTRVPDRRPATLAPKSTTTRPYMWPAPASLLPGNCFKKFWILCCHGEARHKFMKVDDNANF
jgi:hypothetical protein